MPDRDEGFEALPAGPEPPDPDTLLDLQDALADNQATVIQTPEPAPLGRCPAYDFRNHRVLPGVAGGPLMTRGIETLATWIEKCLRTRKGENPACDPGFGCEMLGEDLLAEGTPFDPAAVAEYTAAVQRALTFHPRIAEVADFRIDGSLGQDGVYIDFSTIGTGEDFDELTFTGLRVGGFGA